MGIYIQQLCMPKINKNGKSVEIFWHKGSGGRRKYLVAYSGYNKSEACWLPEIEFYSALGILNDYKVCHGLT